MKINVKVKTNSSYEKIEKISDNSFYVYLKSEPKNNLANTELIKIFSKYFNINPEKIKISFGKTSKNKILEINI
jgi:uncharacterized protein YggU (UPF0235/DUF167 family)